MPFTPSEDSKTLFAERTHLAATIIGAGTHGVLLALSALCLHAVGKTTDQPVTFRRWSTIGYVCLLVVLSTLGNISNTACTVNAFVNNRDFPGGPMAYMRQHYNNPLSMVGFVAFTLTALMEDGYLLYRFMLIYGRNWWFCAVPCLMFIGTIGCSCILVAQLVKPGASIWTKIVVGFATPYWCLNVAFNVLLTTLIIGKIAWALRGRTGSRKEGEKGLKMVALMLVESAAIYAIIGVIYLACYQSGNPVQEVFLGLIGEVQCISPILIMYLVAKGDSFSSKTFCPAHTDQPNLSTIPSCILCGSDTSSSGNSSDATGTTDTKNTPNDAVVSVSLDPAYLA